MSDSVLALSHKAFAERHFESVDTPAVSHNDCTGNIVLFVPLNVFTVWELFLKGNSLWRSLLWLSPQPFRLHLKLLWQSPKFLTPGQPIKRHNWHALLSTTRSILSGTLLYLRTPDNAILDDLLLLHVSYVSNIVVFLAFLSLEYFVLDDLLETLSHVD